MASTADDTAERLTIPGSCHCGAIKFVARNVSLDNAGKCNCTICSATGKLGTLIKPGDITVTKTPSGEPVVITYQNSTDASLFPPELTYYSPAYHRGDCEKGQEPGRHFFCKTCSVNTFIVANIPQHNIGEVLSVNILTLDLKSVGKDLKDVSNPKKMKYVNGLENSFASSNIGEPYPHGLW